MTFRFRHGVVMALGAFALAGSLWAGSTEASAPPATCPGPAIRALISDQSTGKKVPLAGVLVVVVTESGAEVGRVESNDKGVALVCVPEKATYTVKLDTATLPEGEALQGPSEVVITRDRFITNTRAVNFFTGQVQRNTDGYWTLLASGLVNGVRLGIVIAICSVGLSLIFGTTGLTNFAHGEMVTFGGIVAYLLSATWGLNFIVSAFITVALGGLWGIALDWGIFARLRKRGIGLISQMVVSVGLSITLVNLFLMRFGGSTRRYTAFNAQEALKFGPVRITARDLTATLISLVALVAVALMLQRSRLGKATRAVSDNPELASSTGIDSQKIIRIVWFIGGALAALGGVVRGLDEGVKSDMGADLLFLMFAGITLGGLGSAYGALIGGFVIGVFVEVSTLGIPAFPEIPFLEWIKNGVPTELKSVPALAALILILLLRPQGILGRRERVG